MRRPLIGLCVFLVGALLASFAASGGWGLIADTNSNGKGSPKSTSTTTTTPKGTPSTTSTTTPSGSSTTSTSTSTSTSVPATSSTTTAPSGSAPPGGSGGGTLNLKSCRVELNNLDLGFYHHGKLAVENFRQPFKGDIKTEEGLRQFLQGLVDRGCVDPPAMASYARYTGIIDMQSDDAAVNRLAGAYLVDTPRWQRHVDLFTEKLNAAVTVRVVPNTDPTATTDGQREVGGKRLPEVFKEPLKGSCSDLVEVWTPGAVFTFCPGCFQPVRRTPEAPAAKPVPCKCTTPKPRPRPKPKPCTRHCGGTPTTTQPRQTTTTQPPVTTTTVKPPPTTTTTEHKGGQTDPCVKYPNKPGCHH